jgi:hypothetical protein
MTIKERLARIPKVIDFGIAKAIGKWAVESALLTGFGQIVGTPEFASPERADTMTGQVAKAPTCIPGSRADKKINPPLALR